MGIEDLLAEAAKNTNKRKWPERPKPYKNPPKPWRKARPKRAIVAELRALPKIVAWRKKVNAYARKYRERDYGRGKRCWGCSRSRKRLQCTWRFRIDGHLLDFCTTCAMAVEEWMDVRCSECWEVKETRPRTILGNITHPVCAECWVQLDKRGVVDMRRMPEHD